MADAVRVRRTSVRAPCLESIGIRPAEQNRPSVGREKPKTTTGRGNRSGVVSRSLRAAAAVSTVAVARVEVTETVRQGKRNGAAMKVGGEGRGVAAVFPRPPP